LRSERIKQARAGNDRPQSVPSDATIAPEFRVVPWNAPGTSVAPLGVNDFCSTAMEVCRDE
jgi:hypothetical protein